MARLNLKAQLAQNGLIDITPERGIQVLSQLLRQNPVQVAAMPTDWSLWRQAHPAGQESPVIAELVRQETRITTPTRGLLEESSLLQELLIADPPTRRARIEGHLQELVAQVMRLEKSRFNSDQPLNSLGLDSIMAVEIKNRVEVSLGVTLSVVDLLQGASVAGVAGLIVSQLENDSQMLTDIVAEVERLSMDEVRAVLTTGGKHGGREV